MPAEESRSQTTPSHVDIRDALVAVRPLLESAGAPSEIVTRWLTLLTKIRGIDGTTTYISEEEKETRKHVKDPNGREITFIFPTEEQLNKDSQSTDQGTADKANRLKRFEKRLDEAFEKNLAVRVMYTLPDDFDSGQVSADKINSVTMFR